VNTLTVDLALANSGFVVWRDDKIIHNEAIKTEKTSKKELKEFRHQLKILKKGKISYKTNPMFKKVLGNPVKDFFILDDTAHIFYKSYKGNHAIINKCRLSKLIECYETRLKCKAVALDRVRRIKLVTKKLEELINKYDIQHVITELPSGTQSASAASLIGSAIGLFVASVTLMDIKTDYVTPHQVKMATVGLKDATKFEMMSKVKELYPDVKFPTQSYKFEHIADAVGVKLAYDKFLLDNT
jgi:Holliday junction resolvasome RuvABC endonuclease subunit